MQTSSVGPGSAGSKPIKGSGDRTPVIVGVAQSSRHLDVTQLAGAPEPAHSTASIIAEAAADSGGRGLLQRVTGLWIVDPICWDYRDPTEPVIRRLGIDPPHRMRSGLGGETPAVMVNRAAEAIARGDHEVVVIAGTEAMRTVKLATAHGVRLDWTRQSDDCAEPESLSAASPFASADPVHPGERAVGLGLPIHYYPLFENALRRRYQLTIAEHTEKVSRLWSAFSEVAAGNPHSWRPTALTPRQIADVTASNRMICFPYPKLMNADMGVDMSAAIIVCSADAARSAGVPRDRWVFPWAGATCHDHWHVGNRDDLSVSPAIAANGRAVLGAAGLKINDIDHLDLYSCFPSAVQVAADALGSLGTGPPTVTGGFTFAGGPGNNYVSHALATMVGLLRVEPEAMGLVSGNGWFLTKHSLGLFAAQPPPASFRHFTPQHEVDALPRVEVAESYRGPATLETYTVLSPGTASQGGKLAILSTGGGDEQAIAACRTPDCRRAWARSLDPAVLDALRTRELIDAPVQVNGLEFTLD
ncbi:MAG TPA: acetyl-CoA acetyltransferase [Pseudonocardia sp.]|jgi:acetyl-CoA C-acetyltransferase|nr:acetyl-CoA acetyltransferase [Pseudonocardia sp.]